MTGEDKIHIRTEFSGILRTLSSEFLVQSLPPRRFIDFTLAYPNASGKSRFPLAAPADTRPTIGFHNCSPTDISPPKDELV